MDLSIPAGAGSGDAKTEKTGLILFLPRILTRPRDHAILTAGQAY